MDKEFVTYEQALALKELGFDEPCLAGYQFQKATLFSDIPHTLNGNIHKNSEGSFTCAPLYQQAFRWFRKKYNLNGFIFNYSKVWNWKIDLIGISCEDYSTEIDFIHTYEEAEQACLDKLIEIVKNE